MLEQLKDTGAVNTGSPRGTRGILLAAGVLVALVISAPVSAQGFAQPKAENLCSMLPSHDNLTQALKQVVSVGNPKANGGLGNHMWATVVDRSGTICTIAYSGEELGDQWPGSRAVSAAKAFAANGFSLPGFALSTANLYWPSQPENSLYGLEASNAVHAEALHLGPSSSWGEPDDPLVGQRIGGATVFGGGLALYNPEGELVGGLGLSGDQSCTDHVVAWKVRHHLNLDNVPKGVTPAGNDNIIYDLKVDSETGRKTSPSGYGHPECSETATQIAGRLSEKFPTGPEEE